MSLNNTPQSNRVHIAFFGRRNAGKSSIINAITEQNLALVSDVLGTTTDPVYKSMELLPIGPVVMIDTAGLDDKGELGELRVEKTKKVMDKTDIAVIVIDGTIEEIDLELLWIKDLKEKKIPIVGAINKSDIKSKNKIKINDLEKKLKIPLIEVSATTKEGINELKEKISSIIPEEKDDFSIVGDLINPADIIVLVTPIDESAPKGRLILPQQQTIRDILDSKAIAIITQVNELKDTLRKLKEKPKLVITDSQVFSEVSSLIPKDVMLTSFSILFARYKGDLMQMAEGVKLLDNLCDGDKILICEACTHHKQSDDIGSVKIPNWIRQKTGKDIQFDHLSGKDFNSNLDGYKLIIHCGGCMLNAKAMKSRLSKAKSKNQGITNYGIVIAYINGILERALEPFIQK